MDGLRALGEGLGDLVAAAARGVVRVEGGGRPASGTAWEGGEVVITTAEALPEDGEVELGLPGGGVATGKVLGLDQGTGLAAVRLEAGLLEPSRWDDGDGLRVGTLALALGRPGRGPRAALAMVSGLGGPFRTPLGGRVDRYIELDRAWPRGSGGGVLLGLGGEALGVLLPAPGRGGVVMPTPTVRRVVAALTSAGRTRRGYLGVGVQPVRLPEALARAEGTSSSRSTAGPSGTSTTCSAPWSSAAARRSSSSSSGPASGAASSPDQPSRRREPPGLTGPRASA